MMHARALLLSMSLLGAGACDLIPGLAGDETARAREAPWTLAITPPSRDGNLSLVAQIEGRVESNLGGATTWRTIPTMSAMVWTAPGDNLEVEVAASVTTRARLWVRVLIDGAPAAPGDVLFQGGARTAARAFRFVASGLGGGAHLVEAQWIGDPLATITDHNLTVHAAASGAAAGRGLGRLAVVAPPSGPALIHTSARWTKVPGLAASFRTEEPGPVSITFSAESRAVGGAFLVRAVLDGEVQGELELHGGEAGGDHAARSAQFAARVAAGAHRVELQWATTPGGRLELTDRSLAVFSGAAASDGGSFSAAQRLGAVTRVGAGWAELGRQSFANRAPGAIAAIQVSIEAEVGAPLSLHARVDGRLASPGEVNLGAGTGAASVAGSPEPSSVAKVSGSSEAGTSDVAGTAGFAVTTYTFHLKDLPPGITTVSIEARSAGGGARVRDRALAVTTVRRYGADFAQPLEELRPRRGEYRHVVVCIDGGRPRAAGGAARPFTTVELRALLLGGDGRKNVADWVAEQSRGRFVAGRHWFSSCRRGPRPDGWYWEPSRPGDPDGDRLITLHKDALAGADAELDLRQLDRNGDRILSPDEAVVTIVHPYEGWAGQWGQVVMVPRGGAALMVPYITASLVPDDGQTIDPRAGNVGLLAHELSHALFGAQDLKLGEGADPYTTMDDYTAAGHLDPVHKLLSGWLVPDVLEASELRELAVALPPVERSGQALLVHDHRRPGELILIEHRGVEASAGGFDSALALGSGGVVAWHVAFDLATRTWDPTAPPRLAAVLASPSSAPISVAWADGTPALTITTSSTAPAAEMTVTVAPP